MIELNKQFATKLGIMVDSGLINYKHYYKFCDEIIEYTENPPYWIIDLATIKYIPDATKVINEYAYSEPFEEMPDFYDFYIACLYLRYRRREITWASFLWGSGEYADRTQAVKCDCEWFYEMVTELEDCEYSIEKEKIQVEIVKDIFELEIKMAEELYKPFQLYFREYILNSNEKS